MSYSDSYATSLHRTKGSDDFCWDMCDCDGTMTDRIADLEAENADLWRFVGAARERVELMDGLHHSRRVQICEDYHALNQALRQYELEAPQ